VRPEVLSGFLPFFAVKTSRRDGIFLSVWKMFIATNPAAVFTFFMSFETPDIFMCYAMGISAGILPLDLSVQLANKFWELLRGIFVNSPLSAEFSQFLRAILFCLCSLWQFLDDSELFLFIRGAIDTSLESRLPELCDGVIELVTPESKVMAFDAWVIPRVLGHNLTALLLEPYGYSLFRKLDRLPIDLSEDLSSAIVTLLSPFVAGLPTHLFLALKCLAHARASVLLNVWPLLRSAAAIILSPAFEFKDGQTLLFAVLCHAAIEIPFDISGPAPSFLFDALNSFPDEQYRLISVLRSSHTEAEALWPFVLELASREFESTLQSAPFFSALAEFDHCPVLLEHPNACSLICIAIKSLDFEINTAALHFLRAILGRITLSHEHAASLLNAIFEAITDFLHSPVLPDLAETVHSFFRTYETDPILAGIFAALGIGELFEMLSRQPHSSFLRVICDFLVALRRVAPLHIDRITTAVDEPTLPKSSSSEDLLLEDFAAIRA
jgi:hypothetical protein